MFQFGSCPRCQSNIPDERLSGQPVICQACGFTSDSNDQKLDNSFENRFIKVAILTAFAIVVGFLQTASWDKFALEIIPLKIKQIGGFASNQNLIRISEICSIRLKHDCVESAYADLANQGQTEFLADLGKYQVRRGNKTGAVQTLRQYFNQGGLDLEASYQFAKVLGETGQVDLSVNYYDQVLKAKPEVLQVSVTQNYVKMLINNGRRDQAMNLIKSIRKTSPTASMFMEEEFKSLNQASVK